MITGIRAQKREIFSVLVGLVVKRNVLLDLFVVTKLLVKCEFR